MPADWFLELGRFKLELLRFMKDRRIAFVGGVAMRWWRARPGATSDYDLLIDRAKHFKETHAFLESRGAAYMGIIEDTVFYYVERWKLGIDVLLNDPPIFRAALQAARPHTLKGIPVLIVRPLELAAMKVLAYAQRSNPRKKEQDRKDLLRLMTGAKPHVAEAELVELLDRVQKDLIPVLRQVLAQAR